MWIVVVFAAVIIIGVCVTSMTALNAARGQIRRLQQALQTWETTARNQEQRASYLEQQMIGMVEAATQPKSEAPPTKDIEETLRERLLELLMEDDE